jgi:hypothetical protein
LEHRPYPRRLWTGRGERMSSEDEGKPVSAASKKKKAARKKTKTKAAKKSA